MKKVPRHLDATLFSLNTKTMCLITNYYKYLNIIEKSIGLSWLNILGSA